MGQLVVVEQRSGVVGYDELIGLFAVAHGVGVLFVVLDQTHDFELQRLTVVGLDDEDVAQFQRSGVSVIPADAVPGAVRTFDDDFSSWALVFVTFHVGVVLFERLRERMVSVSLVDVVQVLRPDRCERGVDRCLPGIGDRGRR